MSQDQNSTAANDADKLSFADMRLQIGDRIQLQLPSTHGEDRLFVKVIGYLDRASLIVTVPVFNVQRKSLREKDKVLVRIFSRQMAFAFDSEIKKVQSIPYPYLHLSYPEKIQGSLVRKDPRIKVKIIASIKRLSDGNLEEKLPMVINNLSASGGYVSGKKATFKKDQTIQITFQVKVHNIDQLMVVNAIIRSVVDETNATESVVIGTGLGLQFYDVEPNNFMLLQSFVYQQMIEQPDSVI
jgi:c-di-GMP-binding flagellar brake protein YcgR